MKGSKARVGCRESIARKAELSIRAGKLHRADISCGRIAKRILRTNGKALERSRNRSWEARDYQRFRCAGADVNARLCARDDARRRIRGGDGLGACSL